MSTVISRYKLIHKKENIHFKKIDVTLQNLYKSAHNMVIRKATPNITLISSQDRFLGIEKIDITLCDFLQNIKDVFALRSIIFQILQGLWVLQKSLGAWFVNPTCKAIGIKKVTKGGYWKYRLGNISYFVPNEGYIALFYNFDNVISCEKILSEEEALLYPISLHSNINCWELLDSIFQSINNDIIEKDEYLKTLNKLIQSNVLYKRIGNQFKVHFVSSNISSYDIISKIFKNFRKKITSHYLDVYKY
jgi:hypothetical protein